MAQNPNLCSLNQHLFWDVDTQHFELDKNASWIIRRVLEYGSMKDWFIIEDHFGIDKIIAYAKDFRTLYPVALSFLCFVSGTKKEDYRCYRMAQLHPTLWNS